MQGIKCTKYASLMSINDKARLYMQAVRHNDIDAMKTIAKIEDIRTYNLQSLYYILINACKYGSLDTVKYLFEEESFTNTDIINSGYIAVHVAIEKGRIDIVDYLLGHVGIAGSVLKMCKYVSLDLLELFVKHGLTANMLLSSSGDIVPFYLMLTKCNIDIIKYLIDKIKIPLTAFVDNDYYALRILASNHFTIGAIEYIHNLIMPENDYIIFLCHLSTYDAVKKIYILQ